MKNKLLTGVMAIMLAAALIAGGTMAWFTSEADAGQTVFTAGTVRIEAGSSTVLSQNFDPGKAVYLYGAEVGSGDLYEIDVKNGTAHMFYDLDRSKFGNIDQWSPNGLAFHNGKRRLYMAIGKGSNSELWFYDIKSKELKFAGQVPKSTIYGATFGDGYYWYINNASNELYKVSFNEDGTVADIDLHAIIDDGRFQFGDIVFDYRDGVLYGSSNNKGKFFSYNLGSGEYEVISDTNALDLQLAFGSDYMLYGHNSNSGKWYRVDNSTGSTADVTMSGSRKFSDLASGYTSVWNPGDTDTMRYFVANTGTKRARVRARLEGGWYDENDNPWNPPADVDPDVVDLTIISGGWTYSEGYYYYNDILGTDETAELSILVHLNGPKTGNEFQGKTYMLTGYFEAIQASNHAPYYEWGTELFGVPE